MSAERDPRSYDHLLVYQIKDALRAEGLSSAPDIGVTVRDGEVELEGSVADRDELNAVEELVRSVRGVRAVRSRLTIRDEI